MTKSKPPASPKQIAARRRNWRKLRLAAILSHLNSLEQDQCNTRLENMRIFQARNLIRDILQDWDSNKKSPMESSDE